MQIQEPEEKYKCNNKVIIKSKKFTNTNKKNSYDLLITALFLSWQLLNIKKLNSPGINFAPYEVN